MRVREIVLTGAMILLTGFAIGADEHVKNPIDCFERGRWPTKDGVDSTYIGSIFFDPLPEYRQPARVTIDYVAQFDNDNGGFVQLRNQKAFISISPQRYYWTQPIKTGDTLRAQFTIIPQTIGYFLLDFMVYKTGPFYDPFLKQQVEALHKNKLRVVLIIGADGKTFAMNTKFSASYYDYVPFLGPIPELLKDSIVFFKDPKEENELTRTLRPDPHQFEYFAVTTVVYLEPDEEGYREVIYHVSPYHDYPSRVTMEIADDGDMLYKDTIAPGIDPVSESDTLIFGLKFKGPLEKLNRVSVRFTADNPDSGDKKGIYMGYPFVYARCAFNFYEMKQRELRLITGQEPSTYLKPDRYYDPHTRAFIKFMRIKGSLIRELNG